MAALTRVLTDVLAAPVPAGRMGTRGAAWARARFAPDRYAALAVDRLLLVGRGRGTGARASGREG